MHYSWQEQSYDQIHLQHHSKTKTQYNVYIICWIQVLLLIVHRMLQIFNHMYTSNTGIGLHINKVLNYREFNVKTLAMDKFLSRFVRICTIWKLMHPFMIST